MDKVIEFPISGFQGALLHFGDMGENHHIDMGEEHIPTQTVTERGGGARRGKHVKVPI